MGIDGAVIKECDKANMVRRVYPGRVRHDVFFRNIQGHLLMSGVNAGNVMLLADMICAYAAKEDMPVIVLTSRQELLDNLQERQTCGLISRLIISSPASKNYHPMYGMSAQQINRLIAVACEETGCRAIMDQALMYAAAIIDIVSAKYQASLPAVSALLKDDDDAIASFAVQMGMSNVTADNILGSHEAGIMFRRIIERIEEAFENVSLPENDTRYNFQTGSRGDAAVMAFYQPSSGQRLMNAYLKEELYAALKCAPKLRVVLDETSFSGETDELLNFLMQMKRQEKIELIISSENAKEMLCGVNLDFGNVCLFLHAAPGATEEISRDLFGTYQHHYPACAQGRPPAVFFTLQKDIRWNVVTEERLKVRAEDLYYVRRLFGAASDNMAVKTADNGNIYLVPVRWFLSSEYAYPLREKEGNKKIPYQKRRFSIK